MYRDISKYRSMYKYIWAKLPKGDFNSVVPLRLWGGEQSNPWRSKFSNNHSRKSGAKFFMWIGPFIPEGWHMWSFDLNSTNTSVFMNPLEIAQGNNKSKGHHLINGQYKWMAVSMGDFPLSGWSPRVHGGGKPRKCSSMLLFPVAKS